MKRIVTENYDRARDLIQARGDVVFRKVMLKPGGPATFALLDGVRWLALPGNPVSAMVCGHVFVAPVIQRMLGLGDIRPTPISATLTTPIRRCWVCWTLRFR